MSAAAGRPRLEGHLRLASDADVGDADGCATDARAAWAAARPALLRVCAGEPLLLSDDDVDLVALVNRAREVRPWMLDGHVHPDDYRLSEVLVEYLCHRYGIQRRGKGDRIVNLESIYRRHLLPFLIELDAALPPAERGVAAKRLLHLEMLPQILAGDEALPAATVAGEQLGRRGIACIFLGLADAARVVAGGAAALEVVLREGAVPLHTDVRTGADIVRSEDLRAAGVLAERSAPHGVAANSAGNVLRDLNNAVARARAHGAGVIGEFNLVATEPLLANRMRAPRVRRGYVRLRDIAAITPHLPPVGQVVLWLAPHRRPDLGELWAADRRLRTPP